MPINYTLHPCLENEYPQMSTICNLWYEIALYDHMFEQLIKHVIVSAVIREMNQSELLKFPINESFYDLDIPGKKNIFL